MVPMVMVVMIVVQTTAFSTRMLMKASDVLDWSQLPAFFVWVDSLQALPLESIRQ